MQIRKNIAMLSGIALMVGGLGLGNAQLAHAAKKWSEKSKVNLESDQAKLGYTVGVQIMNDLTRSGIAGDLDIEALIAAQRDVLGEIDLRMTPEQMQQAQQGFALKKQQEYTELAEKNKADGEAYLEKNKKKKGVKITDSGLQYEVIREGKGAQPAKDGKVKVHYLGTLIDSTPFDSSYQRNQPAEFPVGGLIPGFTEGLLLMKEGAKYRFSIPQELAYGANAPQSIGPNQALVFEVELLEVIKESAEETPAESK